MEIIVFIIKFQKENIFIKIFLKITLYNELKAICTGT